MNGACQIGCEAHRPSDVRTVGRAEAGSRTQYLSVLESHARDLVPVRRLAVPAAVLGNEGVPNLEAGGGQRRRGSQGQHGRRALPAVTMSAGNILDELRKRTPCIVEPGNTPSVGQHRQATSSRF